MYIIKKYKVGIKLMSWWLKMGMRRGCGSGVIELNFWFKIKGS